jgi:hypothetical protein
MTDPTLEHRLAAFEGRMARLETLLLSLTEKLDRAAVDAEAAKTSVQDWVTDYVSLRLQQLVPHSCEHEEGDGEVEGPVLPGTRIRCTDEVLHRLGRIPIPFVRQMVTQKVAETARAESVGVVDVVFFERAATF